MNTVKLGDLLECFDSARRPIKSVERVDGPTPYLGASGVVDYVAGHTHSGNFLCVSEDGENLRTRNLPIAWVQRGEFWANNHLHVLGGTNVSRLRFIEGALAVTDIAGYLTGSTQPKLTKSALLSIKVPAVDSSVQTAIGEVLGALDDKIAANRHLIGVIGQHCLTTIDRSLSVSATVENLGDICDFHNRRRVPLSKAERNSRIGDIPYYGATSRMGYVNESLFDQQLVLVGEDGSVVDEFGHPIVQYIWGPAWVNNHAHVLTGTVVSTEMLRWLLRRCNVESLITGAVQPKLSMGQLKSLRVDLPSGTELDQAEAIISTLSARERAAAAEIECLARVRDVLLPLLMNGRITVKGAERAAEDVL